MSARLLAFGGPWNEQVVDVEPHGGIVFAAAVVRLPLLRGYVPTPANSLSKTVRYNVKTFGLHDATKCPGPPNGHDDRCRWDAHCLMAEGFPEHRVTDALNGIVGMTLLLSVVPAGPNP